MAFDPSEDDPYGTATQYFGVTPAFADPWQSLYPTSQPLPQGSENIDQQLASWTYQAPDYGWDTAMQDLAKAGGLTKENLGPTGLDKFGSFLKSMGGKAMDFAQTPQGLMALIAAIAGAQGRQRATGGGAGMGMMAPRQYTRSVDPKGIVRYAAEGGLMHAYANGGAVRPFPMQDGGFVMTGDAVKGAGGIDRLRQILPEAKPITGPGTATSDSIPATIRGRNGITPAKVSNGEAYVPPGRDTRGLYALMRQLERNA